MSPLVSSDRFCPPASGPPPCYLSTTFIILVLELPGVSCVLVFVGLRWVLLCPHWSETAFLVRKQKFTATCPSRLPTFRSRFAVFRIFMSIWWARCLALQVFRTFSPWWIGRLVGRKRSRSLPSLPPTGQRPSCKDEYSVLASQASSQATEAHSSHLHFGPPFVPSSPSNTLKPQPTIPSPTASWSGSTAD
jgi:hypothetical protein